MLETKLSNTGTIEPATSAVEGKGVAREQALALAREFESMLMLQMIRQMRQSLLDEDEQVDGLGNETMIDTIDGELARALSASGGLGFARWFAANLDGRAEETAPTAAVGAGVGGLTATGVPPSTALSAVSRTFAPVAAGPAAPVPESAAPATPKTGDGGSTGAAIEGTVTSPFGLRGDPFHGGTRMHAGVDIRAAYGRSVQSAADGIVTVAGERGGYGQVVMVRHADGIETRYAHLSAIDVKVGQHVQIGELVGRVGQSGRATGPHLHFEVLQEGRQVDPLRWAQNTGRLKPTEAAVDLPFDWSPRPVAVNGVDHEN